jgi:hypothetical protein
VIEAAEAETAGRHASKMALAIDFIVTAPLIRWNQ